MFIAPLKTSLVEAWKLTFDGDYPEENFRSLAVSLEFPATQQDYPGIWVDFDPTEPVRIAGVDHHEYGDPDADGGVRSFTRWRFAGNALYTVVALSSFERDRLMDEMVKVLAFGRENPQTSEFRAFIENNEFVAINFDFDSVGLTGMQHSYGTPWETDESVYEATLSMACVGEFVSDGTTGILAPLSAVKVYPYSDQEADPLPDPTAWQ